MTPQVILTCYLAFLTLTGIWREANRQHEYAHGARVAGSTIGVLLKHGGIFGMLVWGGFYAP